MGHQWRDGAGKKRPKDSCVRGGSKQRETLRVQEEEELVAAELRLLFSRSQHFLS